MVCTVSVSQLRLPVSRLIFPSIAPFFVLLLALSLVQAFLLSVAPPLCFLALQLSSLPTIRQIIAQKSTAELSPVPFLALFTNCCVWTTFGVLKGDATVLLPNISGLLFGLLYTVVFRRYTRTCKRCFKCALSFVC